MLRSNLKARFLKENIQMSLYLNKLILYIYINTYFCIAFLAFLLLFKKAFTDEGTCTTQIVRG